MLCTLAALRWLAPRLAKAGLLHLAFFATGGLILWMVAAGSSGAGRAGDRPPRRRLGAGARMVGGVRGTGGRGRHRRPRGDPPPSLEQYLGADAALLAALALRVVTTVGDLLFFGLSCLTPAPVGIEVRATRSQSRWSMNSMSNLELF